MKNKMKSLKEQAEDEAQELATRYKCVYLTFLVEALKKATREKLQKKKHKDGNTHE